MIKLIALFCLGLVFFSCKENKKTSIEVVAAQEITAPDPPNYPEALAKVFDAHGGLAQWNNYKTLSYSMPKTNGEELQTIDLQSRKDKIMIGTVEMGFDGKNVWLLDSENSYKGDPVFYHNLMFYFYAMPFVLADKGINYSEAPNLVFENISYPGIKISYNDGVGVSSKDEYYLYYDPETYQMAWLGYTVTYRSGEKSDKLSWIRYNDWVKVEDILLPKSMTWHVYEDGSIKEAKNTVTFENIKLSKQAEPDAFYAMQTTAKVVTGKE